MSRNPILSDLMHFLGPNLKLNRTFGSINGRMNRLVTIGLAVGNIILEPPRHRPPKLMNVAQHGINITLSIQDAANGNQIINLIKTLLLVLHLAIDRVDMLGPAINLTMQIALASIGLNLLNHLFYQFFTLPTLLLHHVGNFVKFHFIEITEGQIFQLPLDTGNSQAMSQGCVDFHCFSGNPLLLILAQMLQRPHIVETVCQFDQNNPNILRHGHQHLAMVFRQLLLVGFVLDLAQLGNPIHNHAHIRPKLSFQIIQRRTGILNHIMQKAAGNRYRI